MRGSSHLFALRWKWACCSMAAATGLELMTVREVERKRKWMASEAGGVLVVCGRTVVVTDRREKEM